MKLTLHNMKLRVGLLLGLLGFMAACTPEDNDLDLGPTPTSSFTISEVEGENNTYFLTNTTPGAFIYKWDTGGGFAKGAQTEKVFFPDAGTYEVKALTVTSGGSDISDTQTITVKNSDPAAGNIISGAKMEDGDMAYWTPFTISSGVSFNMMNGSLIAAGGNGGHAGIYQAIEVEADKKYTFSMNVTGSGATDTWFEVYFGKTQPTEGQDYSNGGKKFGLNTWAGCGNTAFNGDIALIGCDAELANKKGEITFAESGTVYLVIKTGGKSLGNGGIAIDNVALRGKK